MNRLLLYSLASAGLVLAGCSGPLGPIPGGRLSGPPHQGRVADWDALKDEYTVQLETHASDAYSVNVWWVGIGDHLYVPSSMIVGSSDPMTRKWVRNVVRDPHVRVRLAGELYDRSAVRVTDPAEYQRALVALRKKYDIEPDLGREVWIFRLD